MRVCLQSNVENQSAISKAPSEPVLCEAARLVMQSFTFHLAQVLASEFTRPNILRGPRGEAVMNLLIMLTSDRSVKEGQPQEWKIVDFLQELLNSPLTETGSSVVLDAIPSTVHPGRTDITENTTLWEAFGDDVMYISHFVKAKSFDVLDRECLWALVSRHAGVECPNGQKGIDIILPFIRKNKVLGRYTVSAIVIQVKNDESFKDVPHIKLFDAMNPYSFGLFSANNRDYARGRPPIIRIVAALASPNPAVKRFGYYSSERRSMNTEKQKKQTRDPTHRAYTAYEFWCAGLSHKVWGPIKEEEVIFWRQLLDASGCMGVNYKLKDQERENLRRSQGIAEAGIDKKGHWSCIVRSDTYIDWEDEADSDSTSYIEDEMDVDNAD